MANADPSIIRHRLAVVVNEGLGERAKYSFPAFHPIPVEDLSIFTRADPHMAKWACLALQKLAINATKSKEGAGDNKTTPKKSDDASSVRPMIARVFRPL